MHDSRAVANYFLDLAEREGQQIDPLKIQKLVYYAHGWHLALRKRALITETVEAWKFGPVVPRLYEAFRKFGSSPITEKACGVIELDSAPIPFEYNIESNPYRDEVAYAKSLIESIWKVYKKFSGLQLSTMTHAEGTPWYKTWYSDPDRVGRDIDDELIKEYFELELELHVEQPTK